MESKDWLEAILGYEISNYQIESLVKDYIRERAYVSYKVIPKKKLEYINLEFKVLPTNDKDNG